MDDKSIGKLKFREHNILEYYKNKCITHLRSLGENRGGGGGAAGAPPPLFFHCASITYFDADLETTVNIHLEGLSENGTPGVGSKKYTVKIKD